MKKLVVAVALALLVAACTGGPTSEWEKAYGKGFPGPKDGEAALYIVRDGAPEGAPPVSVTMGQRQVGGLVGLTWMRLDLTPDPYDLRAYGPERSTELIINVTAGETRFLLVETNDSGNARLVRLSQEEGRRLVRKGRPVDGSR